MLGADEECGMSGVEGDHQDRGMVLAEARTDLAIKCSAIAAERTLMAWVRTAISMIGFGFSIVKFFQYLPSEVAKGNIPHPHAPRNLGLTLIMLGTLALAGATWQHGNFQIAIEASRPHPDVVDLVHGCNSGCFRRNTRALWCTDAPGALLIRIESSY